MVEFTLLIRNPLSRYAGKYVIRLASARHLLEMMVTGNPV
jgi:hypothetical protein